MKSFFKPLSKRDASIVAVIFGIAIIAFVVSLIKSVAAGSTFDDVRSDILLIVFLAIIEWAMITIAFSKDKNTEEEAASEEQLIEEEPAEDFSDEDLPDEAEYTEGTPESEGEGDQE